jgi:iduronate 2-sulfatase
VAGSASARRPGVDRAALFERKDVNHDGKLSHEEFMANQPDPEAAAKRWGTFDTNRDGFLSRDEFITPGGKKSAKP